jgi:hypothetical protein
LIGYYDQSIYIAINIIPSSNELHEGEIDLRGTKKRGGTAVAMVWWEEMKPSKIVKNGLSVVKADAGPGSFLIFCP